MNNGRKDRSMDRRKEEQKEGTEGRKVGRKEIHFYLQLYDI